MEAISLLLFENEIGHFFLMSVLEKKATRLKLWGLKWTPVQEVET